MPCGHDEGGGDSPCLALLAGLGQALDIGRGEAKRLTKQGGVLFRQRLDIPGGDPAAQSVVAEIATAADFFNGHGLWLLLH